MKVLTLGWLSVFIYILVMNFYIAYSYWRVPFTHARIAKLSGYISVHLVLTVLSLVYFVFFFTAKTKSNLSKILSYVAAFYIVFIHYSVILLVLHDVFALSSRFIKYPEKLQLWSSKVFFGGFLLFTIAAIISIFGIYNSLQYRVKDYHITLDKKQSQLDSLNIVYLSDMHYGTSVNIGNIDDIIKKSESLKPDLLILGGDIFDEGTLPEDKEDLVKKLSSITTNKGIIYTEGNHEYTAISENINEEIAYFKNSEMIVLRDEVYQFENEFNLIVRKDPKIERLELNELVKNLDNELPSILIDHRPGFKESILEDIDLQISGHTHSGQFFPLQIFNSITAKFSQQYIYGHHKINNMEHIVGSGIGNWGIPSRIGSKREILNINITFD